MNAALNELGSQLFGWFGQLSIELAALAILVLIASRLLPIKSPALRHLLWAIVLLKPLIAVAISSPYTLFTPFVPSCGYPVRNHPRILARRVPNGAQ